MLQLEPHYNMHKNRNSSLFLCSFSSFPVSDIILNPGFDVFLKPRVRLIAKEHLQDLSHYKLKSIVKGKKMDKLQDFHQLNTSIHYFYKTQLITRKKDTFTLYSFNTK